jgi:MFS family permease
MDLSPPSSMEPRLGAPAVSRMALARLLALQLPMALAMYAGFQGLQQILIPIQVEALDPQRKIVNLAFITTLSSITAVLGLLIGGVASDATRTRWGRRAPWLVAMGGASAILLVALGPQTKLAAIVALCSALWFTMNFFQAVVLAIVPDRTPARQRGLASWAFGFAGPLGALLGVNLCALVSQEVGYASLAAILALTTSAFVVLARERPGVVEPTRRDPQPRWRVALRLLHGFSSRDFSLAFSSRALVFLAQYMIGGYLLYALQDYVGADNLPGKNPQIAAGILNTIRTLAGIVTIVAAGWLAHRMNRRKPFVQIYAIGMAAAMLAPALSASWAGMVVFAALGGVSMGIYMSVDLAIMSLVLPNQNAVGRDIAVLAVAGAAPQFLAPALGGALIRSLGYSELFVFAAIVTLIAGALAFFIKGVR